jgi:hypothetical protein
VPGTLDLEESAVVQPYSREFFAPRPSRITLFFRTFLPWQLVRFVWINLKMIRMIGKAHSRPALPPPPPRWRSSRELTAAGNG